MMHDPDRPPPPPTPPELPPFAKLMQQMMDVEIWKLLAQAAQLAALTHGSPEAGFTRVREMLNEFEAAYETTIAFMELEEKENGDDAQ